MEIPGRVENGVVVFVGGENLPEGVVVSIVYPSLAAEKPAAEKRRIELPLVHCAEPGSVDLTNQRIGEILDGEESAPRH